MKTLKKFTAILLTAAIMLATLATVAVAEPEYRYAEIDDALAILRFVIDLPTAFEITVETHDFDGNGKIEIADGLLVLRGIVGLGEQQKVKLGEPEPVEEVRYVLPSRITNEEFAQMVADGTIPRNVTRLDSTGGITDLTLLSYFSNLRVLYLTSCHFDDWSPLANLKNLEVLWLNFSNIDDVSPLSSLTKLKVLNLQAPRGGLLDLTPLHGLTGLERVYLHDTASDEQVAALIAALPNTDIYTFAEYRYIH